MRVLSVNVGRPQVVLHDGRQYSTSIQRKPISGAAEVTLDGFVGDRVSDAENHGGPDKAVCSYPHDHYAYWWERLGREVPIPSFGENLTTAGLLESEACIGDTLRIGSATLQISQPRSPCWKLANRHDCQEIPKWIAERSYTGFYCRVLEPGALSADDEITLIDRPHADLTVALTFQTRTAGTPDRNVLSRLTNLPELSANWRNNLTEKLARLSA